MFLKVFELRWNLHTVLTSIRKPRHYAPELPLFSAISHKPYPFVVRFIDCPVRVMGNCVFNDWQPWLIHAEGETPMWWTHRCRACYSSVIKAAPCNEPCTCVSIPWLAPTFFGLLEIYEQITNMMHINQWVYINRLMQTIDLAIHLNCGRGRVWMLCPGLLFSL